LVENSAEIVDSIEKNAGQHLRQSLRELDLVDVCSRLRLIINSVGPWLTVDEIANDLIEFSDVMLCAGERQARTVGQIGRGVGQKCLTVLKFGGLISP
jgi:hypothetical protein